MQTNGQIIFPSDSKTNRPSSPIKSSPSPVNAPPIKNETASHFGSVLSFLLDKKQKPIQDINKDTQVVQEVTKDAQKEVLKDSLKKKQENATKLDELVHKSNKNLLTISTVFPFTLFPNTVSIDPDKVTVTFTEFFASNNYQTVLIKEITYVEVQTDLFFGSLTIKDSGNRAHIMQVKFLKKKEAEKAREIIQGLVVGTKQEIDFTQFEPEALVKKVEELGQSAPAG